MLKRNIKIVTIKCYETNYYPTKVK